MLVKGSVSGVNSNHYLCRETAIDVIGLSKLEKESTTALEHESELMRCAYWRCRVSN